MARARVDLMLAMDAVLWRLHKAIADYENKHFSMENLAQETGVPMSVIDLALENLVASSFCRTKAEENWQEHPFKGDMYMEDVVYVTITPDGIDAVENWDDEHYNNVVRNVFKGTIDDNLRDFLADGNHGVETNKIPASDRVVELDHNSTIYKTAMKQLDEFESVASESNELGEIYDEPEERDRAISEIRAGAELLLKVKVSVRMIWSLIVPHLKWIQQKLPDALVGASAKKAVEAVVKLLFGS